MRMSAEPECIEITVYFWFEIFATHDESRAQASAAWDLSPALRCVVAAAAAEHSKGL
jgi:hypothetical protein